MNHRSVESNNNGGRTDFLEIDENSISLLVPRFFFSVPLLCLVLFPATNRSVKKAGSFSHVTKLLARLKIGSCVTSVPIERVTHSTFSPFSNINFIGDFGYFKLFPSPKQKQDRRRTEVVEDY